MTISATWERIESSEDVGLEAYVVRPAHPNGHAIVMLQELFGVNEALRDAANVIGEEGYLVAVPDLFWRIQPRVDLGYGKEDVKAAFSYSERFDERSAVKDIAATVQAIRATSPATVAIHLLGFCMGGRLAVLATQDRNVASAISLYGVGIERHLDVLMRANCPIQLHFAGKDQFVPSSAVAAIQQASINREIDIHLYPDAHHGFFPRKRPGHDPAAADAAWTRIRAFMQRLSSK
jgi:carboxymethylenebutenolidase